MAIIALFTASVLSDTCGIPSEAVAASDEGVACYESEAGYFVCLSDCFNIISFLLSIT